MSEAIATFMLSNGHTLQVGQISAWGGDNDGDVPYDELPQFMAPMLVETWCEEEGGRKLCLFEQRTLTEAWDLVADPDRGTFLASVRRLVAESARTLGLLNDAGSEGFRVVTREIAELRAGVARLSEPPGRSVGL